MKGIKRKVFVGLSGGVDSAISALLLKKALYEVVGVFMRTWHPDFLSCNEEEERRDAMRVAAELDIPFLTFDFEKEYKKGVADYMIREYRAGKTPNPDVMCNKKVKFGAFLEKALLMGADFVATGHYAICEHKNGSKQNFLRKAVDSTKEQSYFLWTLNQKQLSKILFPIGNFKKTEVRRLAKKYNLPVAEKKDSQGICFLGDVDLKNFLKHYIKTKRGKVLNQKGEEIGNHNGAVFFTLGERHGFTITMKSSKDKRHYVVKKNIRKNTITVSQEKPVMEIAKKGKLKKDFEVKLKNTNWILGTPKENKEYTMQIRYHGEFFSCKIKCETNNTAKVIFVDPILVASGQSCVLYNKDICIGGGVVI